MHKYFNYLVWGFRLIAVATYIGAIISAVTLLTSPGDSDIFMKLREALSLLGGGLIFSSFILGFGEIIGLLFDINRWLGAAHISEWER